MIIHPHRSILGPIPDDWDTIQLRSCLAVSAAGDWGNEHGEVTLSVLRSTNFTDSIELDLRDIALRGFSQNDADKLTLRRGDILVERSGGGPAQPVGRIVVLDRDLPSSAFSNFVQLLRVDKAVMNPDYVAWCLYRLHACGIIERLQHQTTQMRNLDLRDYVRVYLPRPRPEEQQSIVNSIRLLGDSIRAAQAELEKAQRLKTALLQQLFTKGLPGRHRRFKQTKVGEIPEEWTTRTIRSVLAEPPFSGVSPESRPDPPGTPILNVSCVKSGRCDPGALTYVDVDRVTIDECQARKGDFFVLRGNGNREYVATGGLLEVQPPRDCIFSDKLIRLRFNLEMVVDGFVPLMWQSYRFLRRLQSKAESGSGLWMMSKRDIQKELFAYPKMDEQQQIVAILRSAQLAIDASNSKAVALERLKRSLLQNLLTGCIRLGESATESEGPAIWEPRISN